MCNTCMCPVDGHRQDCPELEDDQHKYDEDAIIEIELNRIENKIYGVMYGY